MVVGEKVILSILWTVSGFHMKHNFEMLYISNNVAGLHICCDLLSNRWGFWGAGYQQQPRCQLSKQFYCLWTLKLKYTSVLSFYICQNNFIVSEHWSWNIQVSCHHFIGDEYLLEGVLSSSTSHNVGGELYLCMDGGLDWLSRQCLQVIDWSIPGKFKKALRENMKFPIWGV